MRTKSSFPWPARKSLRSYLLFFLFPLSVKSAESVACHAVALAKAGSYKSSAFSDNEGPNITEYLGEWREMTPLWHAGAFKGGRTRRRLSLQLVGSVAHARRYPKENYQ